MSEQGREVGNAMEALMAGAEIARAALQQSHAQDYLQNPPTHPQED